MKTDISPNSSERFFERSLRMTALLTLVVSIGFALYLGVWPALAILSGSVWSIVNLLFVRMALVAILRPQGPDRLTLAGILLIKFPALYLAGYFLLSFPRFDSLLLGFGFSIFLIVVSLKAAGRALLKMDNIQTEKISTVTSDRESVLR